MLMPANLQGDVQRQEASTRMLPLGPAEEAATVKRAGATVA